MLDQTWSHVKKILLIRLDNLGDVLLTTPAFHAVREALPEAHLTLLASPVGAQVGQLDPDINETIIYQAPWMDPWHKLDQNSQREQQMIALLKGQHFDAAIIFTSFRQSSLPAAYLCYLADIPLRAAASIDGPGLLLTTRHKHPERMMHEVERGLDLVGALGITSSERSMVLHVPEEARQAIKQQIAKYRDQQPAEKQRSLIVVHPGCSMPARTYPWEMYVEVIKLLIQQFQALIIITGAQEEQELVGRIQNALTADEKAETVGLAGVLPFPELCALIEQADLMITNNTGPMHIAAALKTPTIALFALTNPPEQWGPWMVPHRQLYHEVACRICYSRICPYQHECLRLVSPQLVVEAVNSLLQEVKETTGLRNSASNVTGATILQESLDAEQEKGAIIR